MSSGGLSIGCKIVDALNERISLFSSIQDYALADLRTPADSRFPLPFAIGTASIIRGKKHDPVRNSVYRTPAAF